MNNIGKLETKFDYLSYFELCKIDRQSIEELSIMQLYLLFLVSKNNIKIRNSKNKNSYTSKKYLLKKCCQYHNKSQFYLFLNALYVYQNSDNSIIKEIKVNKEFFKVYEDKEIIKGLVYAF